MFYFRRKKGSASAMVIITFLVTLIATSVAYGNDKPLEYDAPIFEGDALILDAQNYAFEYDVSLDEALQRLKLQDSIGILNNKLMTNEQDTFAGLRNFNCGSLSP